jgi:hypothetical protein
MWAQVLVWTFLWPVPVLLWVAARPKGMRTGSVLLAAVTVAAWVALPISVVSQARPVRTRIQAGRAPSTSFPTATTTTISPRLAQTSSGDGFSLLRVAAEGPRSGYDRALFPLWLDADHDGCNTRYEVLIVESAVPAHQGARCAVTGEWYSAYDGMHTTDASKFDIDHMVPLAEAWDSGALGWQADQRRTYANDLDHPQTLIAVSATSNRSKSDQDPAEWKPPLHGDWCAYADDWISVKVTWDLSADQAEVDSLRSMLDTCGVSGSTSSPQLEATSTTTTTVTAPGTSASAVTVSGLDCAGEAVTVRNSEAVPIDLTGWTIHDEVSKHTFTFPAGYTLTPSAAVVVRSGGAAAPGELHWTDQSVWNNDGDTAYLLDTVAPRSMKSC